jgi:hypothetical protein
MGRGFYPAPWIVTARINAGCCGLSTATSFASSIPIGKTPIGKAEAEERRRLRPASISVVRLDSMGRNRRIVRFILALMTIVGALGAIYVLFFAAGGYYITAMASALILGVGLIWLSDLIDARSP